MDKSSIKQELEKLELPGLNVSVGAAGRVVDVETDADGVKVEVELGLPFQNSDALFRDAIEAHVRASSGIDNVTVTLSTKIAAHGVQPSLKPLDDISNIIAIASGKGGVGKSTTAVNLALALSAEGASVGLLDADIYGPSQPLMLGLAGKRPLSEDGKSMLPLEAHGLSVMSIGFLVDTSQPMAWRGPMVTSALDQLLRQTRWGTLDYLLVDMPPGTGDIQLTLSQRVPVSGAVIVTTPQDIALADARKGLELFRKVSIPVLGIVENMSLHVCSQCGHEEAIFGSGGGERMSAEYDVPLLGRLPLDPVIREQTDGGTPTVVAEPGGPAARAYRAAALQMAGALAARGRDYSRRFPNIVVEDGA